MAKSALIAGATGLVGGHVLQALLDDPAYDRVVAVVRRPLPKTHPKLACLVADFDRLADHAAALKADDVFCCLGTTIRVAGSQPAFRKVDHDYPVALAKAAKAGGAKRYLLVSAVGANASSPVFYSRVKGETERDVAAVGFEAVHSFRPSFLLGERLEHRPGEKAGIALFRVVEPALLGSLRRYRSVEASAVARAMVAAAQRPERGEFKHEYDSITHLATGEHP